MENEIKELNKMHNKLQQRIKSMNEQIERIDQEAIKNNIEIWRKIKKYLNYSVSSHGRVRKNENEGAVTLSLCKNGYYMVNLSNTKNRKQLYVHHLIADTFFAKTRGTLCVDHIDNNRLNNYVNNLRFVTYQENNFNKSISKCNTSGSKGVHFSKERMKWESYISINGRKINLGRFSNYEDAKNARRIKAKELFGEFTNKCEK